MPRKNDYTFMVVQPPSKATAERMVRLLADTLAKYEHHTVGGTFRTLGPEEVGKRPLVDLSTLEPAREAS